MYPSSHTLASDFNLFTRRSYLPFITALNLVVEKLATIHLVR